MKVNYLACIAVLLYAYLFYRVKNITIPSIHEHAETLNSHISIIWSAPFLSGGGYCSEAISLVSSIVARGFDVYIQQHGDGANQGFINGLSSKTQRMLWKLLNKNVNNRGAITIEVCHSEPGAWKPAKFSTSACPMFSKLPHLLYAIEGSYHIGRTMFETDQVPKGWKKRMNAMDEVWVPSHYMKEVFEKNGVRNLHVVGESVNTEFFRPIHSVREEAKRGVRDDAANPFNMTRSYVIDQFFEKHPIFGYRAHVLLSIFKWEYRKGWDVLLESYWNQFTMNDDISLFIVTQEYHLSRTVQEEVDQFVMSTFSQRKKETLAHIKIVTQYIPDEFLPYLYNLATLIVLPTRGEGWGRVAQEAMSCGRAVITTGYGGPLEFINERNAYLIGVVGFNEIREGAFKGHNLVEPNRTQLEKVIQFALKNATHRRAVEEQARRDMLEQYSEQSMGIRLEAEFRRIRDHLVDEL